MEHALSSSIVGAVEAGQKNFEIRVAGDVYAQQHVGDAAVEALDQAIIRHEGGGALRPRLYNLTCGRRSRRQHHNPSFGAKLRRTGPFFSFG